MTEIKTVKVYLEDWKKLSKKRIDKEFNTMADVIHELLEGEGG